MTNFTTSYRTNYTAPIKSSQSSEFVSLYSVKNTETLISGKSRPKNLKFKSRLVAK